MADATPATQAKMDQVVTAADKYGDVSMIALAGVPGTGKSHVALLAAQAIADDPLMVRETQFHPAVTYDTFVEGMRIDETGASVFRDGVFLEWNDRALADSNHRYVLLIEELTRANVAAVLGDLMTYLEYRDRYFMALYSGRPVRVASNLVLIATFNPTDRTALDLDAALLRRLRVIPFPPDTGQLGEMLSGSNLSEAALRNLRGLFEACQSEFPEDFESMMPFGHGIFSQVTEEQPDLHELWNERIVRLLKRPLLEPHPFTEVITSNYPWTDPDYSA
ncbi:MAG: AAA family ATPase [Actinomycetota bacterium]